MKRTSLAIIGNKKLYQRSFVTSTTSLSDIASKEFLITRPRYEIEIGEQLEKLLKELKVHDGARILELAARTGFISAHLASKGYNTTITDFDEDMINKIKQHYEKNGLKGDFQVLDIFKTSKENVGTYDVVFITEILDHYDGQQVVQVLEKMKELGGLVIAISQNLNCQPYVLYNRAVKERGNWRSGLSITRESLADLARVAGLEIVKEAFFSATSLSEWMARQASPEAGESYANSIAQKLISEDQRQFRVLVTKAETEEIEVEERIALYKRAYEKEIENLRQSFDLDVKALGERISNLEDELVTRINSIRQLELVQDYGNLMIKTPIGLLLSVYYQRADLQGAFPEVVNHDYRRLLQWAKETVDGATSDFSTNKLREFREWYVLASETWFANDIERVVNNPIGLLLSLYHQRPDLKQAFPEVKNGDYSKLIRWAAIDGISHDSNSDKLQRFAEWYRGAIPLTEILDSEKSSPLSVVLSLYIMRRDLQRAFPEVVNHDYRRLLQWAKETVDGKTGDSNAEVLKTFAAWYRKVGDNPQQARVSIPAFGTITTYLELLRNLKLDSHERTSN